MSRQFRSDDTSKWLERFGDGHDGDLNYNGGNFGGVPGHGMATFSGTSGQYTGTIVNDLFYFNGTNGGRVGDIVFIHQKIGSNAGKWELNKIIGRSGSTLTFKYPLQNNYTTDSNSIAQIVSSGQFNNVSLSGTTTPYFSGHYGGVFFIVVRSELVINGTLHTNGSPGQDSLTVGITLPGGQGPGFVGGSGVHYVGGTKIGFTGYSYFSLNSSQTTSNYYSGGGGGGGVYSGGYTAGSGGGGGNGTSGGNGVNGQYNGLGGSAVGNSELTELFFGGGGGGGGNANNHSGAGVGSGGAGGGIILIIAKKITVNGNISSNGGAGKPTNARSSFQRGCGGGGAGGSILIKSSIAILGNNSITAIGGVGGTSQDSGARGGDGGYGRIHLDYGKYYSGTTTPSLDVRNDNILRDVTGGAFLFNFL